MASFSDFMSELEKKKVPEALSTRSVYDVDDEAPGVQPNGSIFAHAPTTHRVESKAADNTTKLKADRKRKRSDAETKVDHEADTQAAALKRKEQEAEELANLEAIRADYRSLGWTEEAIDMWTAGRPGETKAMPSSENTANPSPKLHVPQDDVSTISETKSIADSDNFVPATGLTPKAGLRGPKKSIKGMSFATHAAMLRGKLQAVLIDTTRVNNTYKQALAVHENATRRLEDHNAGQGRYLRRGGSIVDWRRKKDEIHKNLRGAEASMRAARDEAEKKRLWLDY